MKRLLTTKIKKLLILLIVLIGIYFLFTETAVFVPAQTEISNSKELKIKIIKEIAKNVKFSDTLFVITSRLYGDCGNVSEYPVISPISKKIDEINHNLNNPFYFDNEYNDEERYQFNGKIIITGEGFDNTFRAKNYSFRYTNEATYNNTLPLKINATVLELNIFPVKKDKVDVSLTNINTKTEFSMNFSNAKWVIQTK